MKTTRKTIDPAAGNPNAARLNSARDVLSGEPTERVDLRGSSGVGDAAADILREADEQLDQVRAATFRPWAELSGVDQVEIVQSTQWINGANAWTWRKVGNAWERGPAVRPNRDATQILADDYTAAAIAFHALAVRIRNKQTGGDDALAEFLAIDRALFSQAEATPAVDVLKLRDCL